MHQVRNHIKSRKHPVLRRASSVGLAATGVAIGLSGAAADGGTSDATAQQVMPAVRASGGESAYKADALSSPKFTQPLVDTPQTVTVIKKELIEQQKASTLTEALRNTPGITLLLGENGSTQTGDAVVMRGFDTSASIFVDNIRDLGAVPRDMFNIEQVEVVKGPSGADNGRGASSGYINLVTKAPTLRNAMSGSASYGSAGYGRLTADLNQRMDLGLPGTAFRLNVMKEEGGVPGRDEVRRNRWAVAPSLAVGLGTPTRATFYYLHQEIDDRPDGGLPTIGLDGFYDAALQPGGALAGVKPQPVDTSNYYGSRSDFNRTRVDMFTARLEHDFGGGLSLTNTSRLARSEQTYVIGGLSGTSQADAANCNRGWFSTCQAAPNGTLFDTDPTHWTVLRSRQISHRENEILTNQTNLSSEFTTAGIKHTLSGGVELIYEKQYTPTYTSAGTLPPARLYQPDPSDAFPSINLVPNGAYSKGDTVTAALYAFDTLALSERVKLNAGLRWERFRTDFNSVALSTAAANPTLPVGTQVPTSLRLSDDLFSWKLGAVYKPTRDGSVYVSVANSKLPPGSAAFSLSSTAGNANNPAYEPQEGRNVELGTKWDLFGGALAVAAAVYRSENLHEPVEDPLTPGVYAQVGKRRVQGVELSAAGQIRPGWDLNLGLGTMDAKIVNGYTGATNPTQGGLLQWTPKLAFTAWTTYRLPFGLTVGGGARYIDSVMRSSTAFSTPPQGLLEAQSYWVADAMAAYEVNRNLSLQLNVYNLTDERYVASLNNSGKRYTPGAPRSALLSATFKF